MSNKLEPEDQSFSIVVLGAFNPAIFQPLWFSANGLVPSEEAENAEISVIHKEVAAFSIGSMQIQVSGSRFAITTVESTQGPMLKDLALGTLEILEHTPLDAIGLNLDMEFNLPSKEVWHALGHRLVPKDDWKPILTEPGLQHLIVVGKRPECRADQIQIQVHPSSTKQLPWCVSIRCNQHYRLMSEERSDVRQRHDEAIRILHEDWTSFCNYARDAAQSLLNEIKS